MESLSLAETAAKIGVTKKCIRYHLGRGALQGQKNESGEWRIWASSVDAFIEQRNKPEEPESKPKTRTMKPRRNPEEEQGRMVTLIGQYNHELAEKNDEIKQLYSRIGWLESQLRLLGEAREASPGERGEDREVAGPGKEPNEAKNKGEERSSRLEEMIEKLADENQRLQRESKMRRRWGIFYPLAEALGFKE